MSESLAEVGPASARLASPVAGLSNHNPAMPVDDPGSSRVRDLETMSSALSRLAEELQDTTWHLDGYLSELDDRAQLEAAEAAVLAGPVADPTAAALAQVRQLAHDLRAAISAAELAALDAPAH